MRVVGWVDPKKSKDKSKEDKSKEKSKEDK